MKRLMLGYMFLLVSLLPAPNGFAQQQQSNEGQALRSKSAQDQGTQDALSSQPGQQLRWAQKSSDILDKKIISRDGKELGTAKDLVIGRDVKIEYVILSVGGFLGIGGERVAVPWDKIRATPNVDQLLADVSPSEIQMHFAGKEKSEEADKGGSRKMAQVERKESPVPLARLDSERAKEFMNQTMVGRNGEALGRVTDLFSSRDGRPLYVVVEAESKRLHPVPAQLVQADPEEKKLSADFDRQAFQNSPSFDEAQISGQQWEPEVRGYYQSDFQSGRSGQQPVQQQPSPGTGQSQNQ